MGISVGRLTGVVCAISVLAGALSACGDKKKTPESDLRTLTTKDKAGEVIPATDLRDLGLLVEAGEPVLLAAMVNPAQYGKSLEKLGELEKAGKLRIEFNPNNSTSEADVAPLLAVRFTAEYLASQEPEALFTELGFESVSIDRVQRTPRPFSRREVAGPARMPFDSIGARSVGALGKGVKIAVIDTGIEFSHPALQKTPSGEPKLLEFKDYTEEGRFRLEGLDKVTDCDERLTTFLAAAQKIVGEAAGNPLAACVRESRSVMGISAIVDINADGNTDGEMTALAFVDKDSARVALDVNRNGELDEGELVPAWKNGQRMEPSFVVTGSGVRRDLRRLLVSVEERLGGGYDLSLGFDEQAHGTHVAGIAAGYMPSGFQGVAPEAKILGYKVCSSVGCLNSAIYEAMIQAAKSGAHVANLSLGGSENLAQDAVAPKLVRFLTQKYGTLFIMAAGNEGPALDTSSDPGNFPYVLSVGAWNPKGTWSEVYGYDLPEGLFYWSSRGPSHAGALKPEVIAPGGAVSSVPYTTARSGFELFNGTSMAAPMVTGLAAVILEAAQNKKLKVFAADRSPSERALILKRALEEGAVPQAKIQAFEQGYGLVSATASLKKLTEWSNALKPKQSLFRYLKVSGDFFEASKSDLQTQTIKIEELDDTSEARRREDYDPAEEWTISTSSDWIEILDNAKRATDAASIRPNTRVIQAGYRIKSRMSEANGVRSGFIDIVDKRTGLRQARLLVTDLQAEELVSEPQLLEDGKSEVSYRLVKENVQVPAGQNRRFFVRVPRGATGLGARVEVVPNNVGLVIATLAGHDETLAQEIPIVSVRKEGSRVVKTKTLGQVAVALKKPGLYEVVLTGHESVPVSHVNLEIRASGLSAPPQAFVGPKGGEVPALNALESSDQAPTAKTTPWFRIVPLAFNPKNPQPLFLTTGSSVYIPIPKDHKRFGLKVAPESEKSELITGFVDADRRPMPVEPKEDGFLVFDEAPAYLVVHAAYLVKLKEKVMVALTVPLADGPGTKIEKSPKEGWLAKIEPAYEVSETTLSSVLWSDPYLGPQPIQTTILVGSPTAPPAAAPPTPEVKAKVRGLDRFFLRQ